MPAIETLPEPRPRTRTTGVWPTLPQVLARGGVIDWPASSSKTIQPPHAAAVLLPAEDTDLVAEALRQVEERKNMIKDVRPRAVQMRGYFDVLELAAAAHPRHPDTASVEDIIRAEKIDLRAHGLTYRKLREFLAAFAPQAAA